MLQPRQRVIWWKKWRRRRWFSIVRYAFIAAQLLLYISVLNAVKSHVAFVTANLFGAHLCIDHFDTAIYHSWICVHAYCKTLIIRAHLIFAKFANSLKSRNWIPAKFLWKRSQHKNILNKNTFKKLQYANKATSRPGLFTTTTKSANLQTELAY